MTVQVELVEEHQNAVQVKMQEQEALRLDAEKYTEERKEFWRLALLAMLGLIAAEWWVYSRRVA